MELSDLKPLLLCAVVFFIVVGVSIAVNSNDPLIVDESSQPENRISSHILDITLGRPASGVRLLSHKWSSSTSQWVELKHTKTNENGRVGSIHPNLDLDVGRYKIHFNTGDYFASTNRTVFYPYVEVVFEVADSTQHYHIPLTLSNFGYSTYKGQ